MAFIEPMHRNKPNITYLLNKRDHSHQHRGPVMWDVRISLFDNDKHEML